MANGRFRYSRDLPILLDGQGPPTKHHVREAALTRSLRSPLRPGRLLVQCDGARGTDVLSVPVSRRLVRPRVPRLERTSGTRRGHLTSVLTMSRRMPPPDYEALSRSLPARPRSCRRQSGLACSPFRRTIVSQLNGAEFLTAGSLSTDRSAGKRQRSARPRKDCREMHVRTRILDRVNG
jgi:hypothetical protein